VTAAGRALASGDGFWGLHAAAGSAAAGADALGAHEPAAAGPRTAGDAPR
jgi:hypothetical protein